MKVQWQVTRFPGIAAGALKLRAQSFYLDGESVVCGKDGVAVFDLLHSKANDRAVFLHAFDLLELNGEDIRHAPLESRKAKLRRLIGRRKSGIVYNEHVEGDEAPIIFKQACKMG
jgi:ATP-dependent DNA ligase